MRCPGVPSPPPHSLTSFFQRVQHASLSPKHGASLHGPPEPGLLLPVGDLPLLGGLHEGEEGARTEVAAVLRPTKVRLGLATS